MKMILLVIVWILCLITAAECRRQIVDLSHSLNPESQRWPTARKFQIDLVVNGTDGNGDYYSSNDVCFSEHTGTHLDAPSHYSIREGIWYSSTIPVERLVGQLSLIDLEKKAESDRDYVATANDVTSWEKEYGEIPKGAIVLFNFGWSKYWDSYELVYGSTSNDSATFHFPGVSLEAAIILGERGVYGVGVDTPSVDSGNSDNVPVHWHLQKKNIYFLENVGDTSELPPGGAGVTLIIGAMKTDKGSGGPARVIAMFDDEVTDSSTLLSYSCTTVIAVLLVLCL